MSSAPGSKEGAHDPNMCVDVVINARCMHNKRKHRRSRTFSLAFEPGSEAASSSNEHVYQDNLAVADMSIGACQVHGMLA